MFNVSIGSESPDIQTTARSALLQMLNTILKRVGQQVPQVSWRLSGVCVPASSTVC